MLARATEAGGGRRAIVSKSAEAFRTISEVADELEVPKHVLRFWEQKFPQIRPMKRGGGRRYYRPEDMELLRGIRHLLHLEGYTIRGVQKILRTQGVDGVKRSWLDRGSAAQKSPAPSVVQSVATRKRGASKVPASASGASAMSLSSELRATLEGAIAELEACRRLLSTPAAAASDASGAGQSSRTQR
jgi:DNA-binding transcriptional MerR regulator